MNLIVLDAVSKSLRASMAEAMVSNEITFTANYADTTSTTLTEGNNVAVSSGSANVEILAAPAASTRRVVRNVTVYNGDTVSHVITLFVRVTSTDYGFLKTTLAAGAWYAFDEMPAAPVKASAADVTAGTDDTKFVTPKALKDSGVAPVKASGAELTTGTDDAKFATAKALSDASIKAQEVLMGQVFS